uniref:Uncharacterized protein n=1 Tax=Arion vulgaris TaxID=1028688 RepID=A0A0B6Z4Y6_9EUPU
MHDQVMGYVRVMSLERLHKLGVKSGHWNNCTNWKLVWDRSDNVIFVVKRDVSYGESEQVDFGMTGGNGI